MNDNARFNLFNILPAIIITIAICIIEKNPVALVSFLIVYPIWAFLQIFFSERISFYNDKRKKQSKLLIGLNINKKQWNNFSNDYKIRLREFNFELQKTKRFLTEKRKLIKYIEQNSYEESVNFKVKKSLEHYWLNYRNQKINNRHYEISIENEIKKELDEATLEQKFKLIEKYKLEIDKISKIDTHMRLLLWKQKRPERERLEKIRKSKEKIKKEKEEKENQIKLNKKRALVRLQKEKERELQEKEILEREKKKELEEIEKKQLLEKRKKQEKERYKEYYKRRQREKEKRRHWESEAIEEMIDSGEIDGNVSSDRKRTIPSNIKEIVYARDKGCCVTCGSTVDIEYDHIIPFSKGGSNSVNNVQLLCLKCNRSKSDRIM